MVTNLYKRDEAELRAADSRRKSLTSKRELMNISKSKSNVVDNIKENRSTSESSPSQIVETDVQETAIEKRCENELELLRVCSF